MALADRGASRESREPDPAEHLLPRPADAAQPSDSWRSDGYFRSEARAAWAEALTERLVLFLVRPRTSRPREALQSGRAKRILGQLRRYALLSALLSGLSLASVVSLVLRGSAALVASGAPECRGPLREWLVCFGPATWLQGLAPLCVVLAALVRCESHNVGWALVQHLWPLLSIGLFCWCAVVATSVRPPSSCHALDGLAFEIVALQCLSSCVVVTMDVCLLEAQPLLKKLNSILSGRTSIEAATLVAQLPGCQPPVNEDCAICLGCAEDEEDPLRVSMTDEGTDTETSVVPNGSEKVVPRPPPSRWLRLHCGHAFHRHCLYQWVTKARPTAAKHCPMCRAKFREAPSRPHRQNSATAAAGATASRAGAPLLGGVAAASAQGRCGGEASDAAGAFSSGSAAA